MKILFFTDNFYPEVNAPASRTFEHCQEWVKLGHEVTIITSAPNFPQGKVYPGYKNKIFQIETIKGIKVIRVITYITANKGFLKRVLDWVSYSITATIAGFFISTDIIFTTSPQFFVNIPGVIHKFFKRKPWILEVRDLWPDSIKAVGRTINPVIFKSLLKLESFFYSYCDMIIPVTNSFKDILFQKGVPIEKIKVFTNGVKLEQFVTNAKHDLSKLNSLKGEFIIGYMGTHGEAHNLDFILRMANKVKDLHPHVKFLFIGDGAKKEELLKLSKKLQLSNTIFLDPVKKEEVPNCLEAFTIGIIPLRKCEEFKSVIPSKTFEFAAMGIPILLGVEGEILDILNTYDAGLSYIPSDPKSFMNQLNKLIEDKNLRSRLSENGRRLAKDYSRKKIALNLMREIEKLHEKLL